MSKRVKLEELNRKVHQEEIDRDKKIEKLQNKRKQMERELEEKEIRLVELQATINKNNKGEVTPNAVGVPTAVSSTIDEPPLPPSITASEGPHIWEKGEENLQEEEEEGRCLWCSKSFHVSADLQEHILLEHFAQLQDLSEPQKQSLLRRFVKYAGGLLGFK